jgi:8-oxo-dGTP pyrophosphatase MutT (NUDIX family)
MAAVRSVIYQSAVLPTLGDQLCVITSRGGRRWGFPKGAIEHEETGPAAALREAWEEAGLLGMISGPAIGIYLYRKDVRLCHVTLYPMEVERTATRWPECEVRDRLWLPFDEAVKLIHQPALRELSGKALANLLRLASSSARPTSPNEPLALVS